MYTKYMDARTKPAVTCCKPDEDVFFFIGRGGGINNIIIAYFHYFCNKQIGYNTLSDYVFWTNSSNRLGSAWGHISPINLRRAVSAEGMADGQAGGAYAEGGMVNSTHWKNSMDNY